MNFLKEKFSLIFVAWEDYAYKIGTEDGPLRYVIDDSDSNLPHLNNFVAFDMEYWWAERSISSMINQKPCQISSQSSILDSDLNTKSDNLELNLSVNLTNTDKTKKLFSKNEINQIKNETTKNKKNSIVSMNDLNLNTMNTFAPALISSSKSNISSKPLCFSNNLQPCFS